MMTTTTPKPLRTWSAEKANAYRAKNPENAMVFHFLLDMSPSMVHAAPDVRRAYNHCLRWLQGHCSPMSLGHVVCFDDRPRMTPVQGLARLQPLTDATYDPLNADGTAIYEAMGMALSTQDTPGTHILVLMTDGADCCKRTDWTLTRCHELFVTLQQESGWVGVGFFVDDDALALGTALGFPPGNCLRLQSDQIPEAFRQFQQAMQRYLAAPQAARTLLAAGGFF